MDNHHEPRPWRTRAWRSTALALAGALTALPGAASVLEAARPAGGPRSQRHTLDAGISRPVGPLHVERAGHEAVVLDGGRVLIVGGTGADGRACASAEVFDPRSDTFATVPVPGEVQREGATAVPLADGRALLVGGRDGDRQHDSLAIFDPADQSWRCTRMQMPRERPLVVALSDGRALIAGGLRRLSPDPLSPDWEALGEAEVFDPASGTTANAGDMLRPRAGGTATLLADGRVLVAGAWDGGLWEREPVRSAELFDPATGRFVPAARLVAARWGHTAALLGSGLVLLAGGFTEKRAPSDSNILGSTELYDPVTDSFRPSAPMTLARGWAAGVVLPDGRALVAGGIAADGGSPFTGSIELFDPVRGRFISAGTMADTRTSHAAALLPDGDVLVSGGLDHTGTVLASAERFTPPPS